MLKAISATVLSIMLVSCGGGGGDSGGSKSSEGTQTTPPPTSNPNQSKITLMVYFAADNNLGPYAKQDIEELRLATANSNIRVIFQTEYPESSHTMRGVIENNTIQYIDTGSNLNMADKKTLSDFISWGKANYSSDRYVVSLWSHGLGWRLNGVSGDLTFLSQSSNSSDVNSNVAVEQQTASSNSPFKIKFNQNKFIVNYSSNSVNKGAIADDTSNAFMSIADIGNALNNAGGVDVLVFDACLMQMTEVAYALKDSAKVMVASEDNVPATGFNYTSLINSLINSTALTTQQIGTNIAKTYINSYSSSKSAVHVSNLDLTKIADLRNSITNFAASLYPMVGSEKGNISQAKQQSADFYNLGHMDLLGFMQNYRNITVSTDLKTKADDVIDKANSVVLYSDIYIPDNTTSYNQNAKGLALYLPSSTQVNQDTSVLAQYQGLSFNNNVVSGRPWYDVVQSYSNATAIPKVTGKFDYIARWDNSNIDIDLMIQDPSNSILTAFNSSSSVGGNGSFTQDSIISNQPTESYFANESISSGKYGVYLFYSGCNSNGTNPSTAVSIYYKDRTKTPAIETLVGTYNLSCARQVPTSIYANSREDLQNIGNGFYNDFRFVQEITR
jgi:hypothetical protein